MNKFLSITGTVLVSFILTVSTSAHVLDPLEIVNVFLSLNEFFSTLKCTNNPKGCL